ncbi:hypothetical protein ABOM_012222 [Aspergillus bombycis]|uniref:Uncharacterized protein n=1 Tax=Aspergillus bombycis TaxID=109264 RepID=A0A1F7ZI64_9EURO|nr:hypothetical protein ABOM_012222 [Aspergillus bombycis]OGM39147.1 hypothetical protein ABOM_012222 [Aspergillus bombycis]
MELAPNAAPLSQACDGEHAVSQNASGTGPRVNRKATNLIVDTQYESMLRELADIHWSFNFLSGSAGWILLAGYLVIPGTFTTLQASDTMKNGLPQNNAERAILNTIQNPPLVGIACSLLAIGAGLTASLFLRWKHNYLWLINRLFIPTSLNASAGLLTTIINIYTAKNGKWSIMSLLTVIITALSAAVSLALTVFYKFWKMERIKRQHDLEQEAGWRLVYP